MMRAVVDQNQERYFVTYVGEGIVRLGKAGVFQHGTSAWVNAEAAEEARAGHGFVLGWPSEPTATSDAIVQVVELAAPAEAAVTTTEAAPPAAAEMPAPTPPSELEARPIQAAPLVPAGAATATPATAAKPATRAAGTSPPRQSPKTNPPKVAKRSTLVAPPVSAPKITRK